MTTLENDSQGGSVSTHPGSERPIVGGFYPDPTVCRVNDTYYLAHSSFEFFPGIPIWASSDLIHWEQIGNVITRPEQFAPGRSRSSAGIYAPSLRFHEGKFWVITTDVGGDGHIAFWATDPAGPWSDPVAIKGLGGIDPDLAWDKDGTCYLTCCTSDPGRYEISQARIDLEGGRLLEPPRVIWNGTGLQWPEGPHLYQIGDWWYLLIAEGGTERGHTIAVARAPRPEGPYEGNPGNPIFTHRSTDHPVFSVGHGDFVQMTDGTWAMVYLGVRPHGYLPGHHVNGRETFLAGVDWVDGWPVINENRFQIPDYDHSFTDDFQDSHYHPRWSSPGEPIEAVATRSIDGLHLVPGNAINGSPSGPAFHITDERWALQVEVETSGSIALRLRQDDRHWYEVGISQGTAYARLNIGPVQNTESRKIEGEIATLMMSVSDSLTDGPDDVILSVRDIEGVHQLARADGRYLSTETAGGFIGRVALLHAPESTGVVQSVRYKTHRN